jgi:hypothetical protein
MVAIRAGLPAPWPRKSAAMASAPERHPQAFEAGHGKGDGRYPVDERPGQD